jgi:nitrogen fixation NifU-like protein
MPSDQDMALDQIEREVWAGYSATALDHARNPRNVGSIPDADGFGSTTGDCGDTMGIWLKVSNGVIRNITFWTDGCFSSIAAGSAVTELARGRSVPEALGIRAESVIDALGGMPEESAHCAQLAANTLNAALRDYLALKSAPWKRAYRSEG